MLIVNTSEAPPLCVGVWDSEAMPLCVCVCVCVGNQSYLYVGKITHMYQYMCTILERYHMCCLSIKGVGCGPLSEAVLSLSGKVDIDISLALGYLQVRHWVNESDKHLILVHLILVHLIMVHLIMVHLIMVHLIMVHLIMVHLIMVHLIMVHFPLLPFSLLPFSLLQDTTTDADDFFELAYFRTRVSIRNTQQVCR